MAKITDLSDLIIRMTGGQDGNPEHIWVYKDYRVGSSVAIAPAEGRLVSLWQYNGIPGGGATPGAVSVPDNTTSGSLKQTDPSGGRQKWLLSVSAAMNNDGILIIYDRLLHAGGFSGVSLSTNTVGGTISRYTSGAGNEIWIEVYTLIGTTATTATIAYTNQDGNGQTTSVVIGGTGLREAQRLVKVPLVDGDTGVRSVESVTLSGSTGTAGNYGITIAHPLLCLLSSRSNVGVDAGDFISGVNDVIEITAGSCLAFAWLPTSTTSVNARIICSLHTIEK